MLYTYCYTKNLVNAIHLLFVYRAEKKFNRFCKTLEHTYVFPELFLIILDDCYL